MVYFLLKVKVFKKFFSMIQGIAENFSKVFNFIADLTERKAFIALLSIDKISIHKILDYEEVSDND